MPRDDIIIELFGQNTRGLKTDDKLEELRGVAAKRKAYAVGVQETWRIGQGTLDSRGWKFVTQGKTEMTCNRGSGGVGILLSPDAVRDWEAADSEVLLFGERILAVRLQLKDADKRSVRVLLASAYAPVSSAPQAERDAFLSELETMAGVHPLGSEVPTEGGGRTAAERGAAATAGRPCGPGSVAGAEDAGRAGGGGLGREGVDVVRTVFLTLRCATRSRSAVAGQTPPPQLFMIFSGYTRFPSSRVPCT
jgi:hypothetical protein